MENYHELEQFHLSSNHEWPRKELHTFLSGLGFESEDDFYHLQRQGKLPVWQTTTLLSLDVQLHGAAVYETEEDVLEGKSKNWDGLLVKYYLATTPKDCIQKAVDLVSAICARFKLQISYGGKNVSQPELSLALETIATQLANNLDEPGSETLAILIEQARR